MHSKIIFLNNEDCSKKSLGLVWRPEWITAFESPWSALEKFKFANMAFDSDVFDLFGTSHVQNLKTKSFSSRTRDVISLTGLSDDEMKQYLGISLIELNKAQLEKIIGMLPEGINKESNFIQGHLITCTMCIQKGHHSIFHQLTMLKHCPYHQVELQDKCPKCKKQIPYEISDKYLTSPFTCKCGYSFYPVEKKYSFCQEWGEWSTGPIIDQKLLTWLSLNEVDIEKLKKIHFNLHIPNLQYNYLIPRLLSILGYECQLKS